MPRVGPKARSPGMWAIAAQRFSVSPQLVSIHESFKVDSALSENNADNYLPRSDSNALTVANTALLDLYLLDGHGWLHGQGLRRRLLGLCRLATAQLLRGRREQHLMRYRSGVRGWGRECGAGVGARAAGLGAGLVGLRQRAGARCSCPCTRWRRCQLAVATARRPPARAGARATRASPLPPARGA